MNAIFSAIVSGMVAALSPTAKKAVKDAYAGLKQYIIDRYDIHQAKLEKLEEQAKQTATKEKPSQDDVRTTVKDMQQTAEGAEVRQKLDDNQAPQDEEFMQKIESLISTIEAEQDQVPSAVGVLMKDIRSKLVEFDTVRPGESGTVGVQVEDSDIDTVSFGDVNPSDSDDDPE